MTFTEILRQIQRHTNTQNTSTSSYPLADKVVDVNNTLNIYMLMAMKAEGRWQVDDSNHTDYPIILGDIISGQQDYTFSTDEDGNQILHMYKVRVLQPDGVTWLTIPQRDLLKSTDDDPLNSTATGTPQEYDITANGLMLSPIPDYNMRLTEEGKSGLEMFVSRTTTYFTVDDTIKKPGIPWTHHEYLAIRPAYFYCLQKGLPQTQALYNEMVRLEQLIVADYSSRNKDEDLVASGEYINSV